MKYDLAYAGIPFITDDAAVFRAPPPDVREGQAPEKHPIRKHQPLADLIDELDRLLPWRYLQDFAPASYYPGRNLGALALPQPTAQQPGPQLRIGDWYYPPTACRWSVFRGLMTSSMVKEVLKATDGIRSDVFVMEADPDVPRKPAESYRIVTEMFMLPPRPLAEHGSGFDGLFLITLVDDRYYWQNTPVSLTVRKDTTWGDLIGEIASVLDVTISYSAIPAVYSQPEPDSQLWSNGESAAVLLDAIASNTGRVVVRELDGDYVLLTYDESQARIATNRPDANRVVRRAGGDLFDQGKRLPAGDLRPARNAVIPERVVVTFPKYVIGDDPVPHFLNPRYQNQRPSAWYEESYGAVHSIPVGITSGGSIVAGLTGQGDHVVHSTAKALVSGEITAATVSNASGLTALSMQLARDFYDSQVISALDESYPGSRPWTPEGLHDIVRTYSVRSRQATTRVMHTIWNQVVREFQHATPALSGSYTNTPKGVGGPSVAQSWTADGSRSGGATLLGLNLTSGGATANLFSINGFPTQNRWRGRIGIGAASELVLFEGTSGGNNVGIAHRGIDGTVQRLHAANEAVAQIVPDTAYGVNLVQHEKGQFAYPGTWTSGGISTAVVVPQTQTVLCTSTGATTVGNRRYYPGRVSLYSTPGSQFQALETVWIVERNEVDLSVGHFYDGQFVGYSHDLGPAPVYLVDESVPNGGDVTINIDIDNFIDIDITNITYEFKYVSNFYSTVNYFSTVNYYSIVNITYGQLLIPIWLIPGPPTVTPGGVAIYWNCVDGLLYLWDPCTNSWKCFRPGPCDSSTGTGPEDYGGTCDCAACPDGAPTVWAIHVEPTDDTAYEGLAGDWNLVWQTACTWAATDGDGNQWIITISASPGLMSLVGTTDGGATVTFFSLPGASLCCSEIDLYLDSSSTGTFGDPAVITALPVGECPECPDDGEGTCDCECCPDGAPLEWDLSISGFTEDFASLNGNWTLTYAGDCFWQSSPAGTYPRWYFRFKGCKGGEVGGYVDEDTFVWYRRDIAPACCDDNFFERTRVSGFGVGDTPTGLTLTPGTACTCDGGTGGDDDGDDGSDVSTACCGSVSVPRALVAAVANAAGGCTCLAGFQTDLDFDLNAWGNVLVPNPCDSPPGADHVAVTLTCNSGVWQCQVSDAGVAGNKTADPALSTCSPLHLVFHFTGTNCMNATPPISGGYDIIITERP